MLIMLRKLLKKLFFAVCVRARTSSRIVGRLIMDWLTKVLIYFDHDIFWIFVFLGYSHSTVNHSRHFKDPVTGIHSNTIEGRCILENLMCCLSFSIFHLWFKTCFKGGSAWRGHCHAVVHMSWNRKMSQVTVLVLLCAQSWICPNHKGWWRVVVGIM